LMSVKLEKSDPEQDCEDVEFGDIRPRWGLCDRKDEACDLDGSTILMAERRTPPCQC
jgi:hypothetical protein